MPYLYLHKSLKVRRVMVEVWKTVVTRKRARFLPLSAGLPLVRVPTLFCTTLTVTPLADICSVAPISFYILKQVISNKHNLV